MDVYPVYLGTFPAVQIVQTWWVLSLTTLYNIHITHTTYTYILYMYILYIIVCISMYIHFIYIYIYMIYSRIMGPKITPPQTLLFSEIFVPLVPWLTLDKFPLDTRKVQAARNGNSCYPNGDWQFEFDIARYSISWK